MTFSKPAAPESPLVELCSVSKTYGSVKAVRCVSLRIHPGEIFALLGPNGAGKSTLLAMVLGVCKPTHGLVRVCGMPAHDPSIRGRVSGILQGMSVPPSLRVAELIGLFRRCFPGGMAAEQVLEITGLGRRRERYAGELSSGERQRLLNALVLIGDPHVAILDEPTSCLDPCGRESFHEAAQRIAARGGAVLFTTHDATEARGVAHRVAVLAEGALSCCSH